MLAITDLPTDILYTTFPYLSVTDFLSFTSSCKALSSYRLDPTYWRTLTENTFRIPPQPLLQAGGTRWQWLYKRLLKQTQLYTWGNDDRGNLGPSVGPESTAQHLRRGMRVGCVAFPQQVDLSSFDVGIVADVQCGGWSTTLLNSIGVIYMFGIFNGEKFHRLDNTVMRQLVFPAAYPATTKTRHEPSTAIRQFSTGRNHVLGLSDDGKVWSWTQIEARQIKLLHVDLTASNVVRVVAGWNRSSLYVKGVGIVYWRLRDGRFSPDTDTYLTNSMTVPGTGHIQKATERASNPSLASDIGEVTNHIVLANYIVFITHLDKVFAWNISSEADVTQLRPFELTSFYPSDSAAPFQIRDIQGSFQSFALFTKAGDVFTAYQPLLDAFFEASTTDSPRTHPLPEPSRIASLQNQDVISLAFGDYHIHALHANGTISSLNKDPQKLGAFGLGAGRLAILRGVQGSPNNHDGNLDGSKRRTIWFEPLMEQWMKSFHDGTRPWNGPSTFVAGNNSDEEEREIRDKYGDYFEKEGQRWEDGVTGENEMGAYFALKVAAAGWHSAALVLVDEEKAERVRAKYILTPKDKMKQDTIPQNDAAIKTVWDSFIDVILWSLEPLMSFGRWFLGLPARHDPATNEPPGNDEEDDGPRYVWEGQELPHLWDAE